MTINDIIKKNYDKLHQMCQPPDVPVYLGKTKEDILNDSMIVAINKFKNKEIDEQTGFEYIKKTFLMECLFIHKRKDKDFLITTDNLMNYDLRTTDE